MPRVISVIESQLSRGSGARGDTCRIVRQYHTLEGDLLAENDPYTPVVSCEKAAQDSVAMVVIRTDEISGSVVQVRLQRAAGEKGQVIFDLGQVVMVSPAPDEKIIALRSAAE